MEAPCSPAKAGQSILAKANETLPETVSGSETSRLSVMSHVFPIPTYLLVIIAKNFPSPNALFGTLLAPYSCILE